MSALKLSVLLSARGSRPDPLPTDDFRDCCTKCSSFCCSTYRTFSHAACCDACNSSCLPSNAVLGLCSKACTQTSKCFSKMHSLNLDDCMPKGQTYLPATYRQASELANTKNSPPKEVLGPAMLLLELDNTLQLSERRLLLAQERFEQENPGTAIARQLRLVPTPRRAQCALSLLVARCAATYSNWNDRSLVG